MADEKNLFNKDSEKDNNKQKHSIMKEDEVDIVDFSSAFEDEDESEKFNEFEDFEDFRPIPALFRGLSFLRRKRTNDEEQLSDKEKVEENKPEKKKEKSNKEKASPEKKEKEKNSPAKEEKAKEGSEEEKSSVKSEEPKKEEFPKKKKKKKNKNKKKDFQVKETKEAETQGVDDADSSVNVTEDKGAEETEASVNNDQKFEQIVKEQSVHENIGEEVLEVPDEQEKAEESKEEIVIVLDESSQAEDNAEEIVLIEEFEDDTVVEASKEETNESEIAAEEEEKEEKKSSRFSFLNRRERVMPSQEDIPEETVEEAEEEAEIELLPSFEEAEAMAEKTAQTEPVEEKEQVVEAVQKFEEIPPFEATVEKNEDIQTDEEKKEFEEIPPFEATIADAAKTEKNDESTGEQEEKPLVEPMTMKDHLTFILIILALLLTIVFIVLKFIPLGSNDHQNIEIDAVASENVSEIEIQRKGTIGHLIQADIDNLFYAYSSDYTLTFYQSNDRGVKILQPTGSVNAIVDVKNEKLSVKVDYVELDGKLFGTGLFRKTDGQGNYLHDMVVFKLVNLPKGYEEDGKALLLATSNSEAVSRSCNVWDESFVVELETGATTKFISNNGNMYLSYSILTNEGYVSTNGKIPFFTTRDYDATTNKKDIYLKDGSKETSFAKDVAGSFVYVNGDTISYLKSTDKGFDVIRNEKNKEKVVFSLDGNTSYLYHNEYLLDKYNGIIYNVKTGDKITVTGYGMSNPEMMTVSDDGRYLVVLGAVNSAIDYQVHIFDLKKNNYAKFTDDNFSKHENLVFVNKTTVMYSVVEPSQGYEYVMIDVAKAVK